LPVITARTSGGRRVQNEIDTVVERGEIGFYVGALRGNSRIKGGLHLLDGQAAVVARGLPVIAARTGRSRGVKDEVDARVKRGVVSLDVGALRGDGGVKSELHLLDVLAAVVASSLPVITARTRRRRLGVQDEVDAPFEISILVVPSALVGDAGVSSVNNHAVDINTVIVG